MASKMGYEGEIEKGKTKSMKGMKDATLPKEHFEHKMDNLDGVDLRYASEMNAAKEYKEASDGLKNFVRKNKMNYHNGQ